MQNKENETDALFKQTENYIIKKEFEFDIPKYTIYSENENFRVYSIKTIWLAFNNTFIFCSGYESKYIIVFNLQKKQFTKFLKGHQDTVFSIAIEEKHNLMVSGGRDRHVLFWEITEYDDNKLSYKIKHRYTQSIEYIVNVRIVPGTTRVFALNRAYTIFEFDETFKIKSKYKGFYCYFRNYFFQIHSKRKQIYGIMSNAPHLFHTLTIEQSKRKSNIMNLSKNVSSIKVLERNRLAVCGNNSAQIFFISLKSKKQIFRFEKYNTESFRPAGCIDCSANENYLFIGVKNDLISIFKVNANKTINEISTIDFTHLSNIDSLFYSDEDSNLLVGDGKKLICFKLLF